MLSFVVGGVQGAWAGAPEDDALFERAQRECQSDFAGEIDHQGFAALGMNASRTRMYCKEPLNALANTCRDHEPTRKNAGQLKTVMCKADAVRTPKLSVEGEVLVMGLGPDTGNLYSDAYAWLKDMPAVGGGLSMAQVDYRTKSVAGLDKDRRQVTERCGTNLQVTIDEAGFGAGGMSPGQAVQFCSEAVRAVAHVCSAGPSHKADLSQYTSVSCSYEDRPKIGLSLDGTALRVRLGEHSSNLYSDAYDWLEGAPPPFGGMSAEERDAKARAMKKLNESMAHAQTYCHTAEPVPVDIDWNSFAPALNGPYARPSFGAAGVVLFCKSAIGLTSLCMDRPDAALPSLMDRLKGYRCRYDPDADEPTVSVSKGLVTIGYNRRTSNMHRAQEEVDRAFP